MALVCSCSTSITWSKDTASSLRLACKPENWLSAAHFTTIEVHCKNPMEDQRRQTGLCSERKSSKSTQGNPCLTRNSPSQRFNLPMLNPWPKIRATRALSHDKDYWPGSQTLDPNGPRDNVALFHRTTSNTTKLHILEQQHRSQIIWEVWCVLVMALWHKILWTDKL